MKLLLNRIVYFIKPYIGMEVLGLILTILNSAAVFASPKVTEYLIDDVLPANSMSKLYAGLLLFFAVLVAQPVIGYFRDIVFLYISEKISLKIKSSLFGKVITAPLKFFDLQKKGDIISRVINSSSTASDFLCNFFISFLRDILLIIMILAGMFYTSAVITLIVIVLFIIASPISIVVSRKFKDLSRDTQKNQDKVLSTLSHSVDSIITIKAFSMEKPVKDNFNNAITDAYKTNIKMNTLEYLLNNISFISIVFSMCIIYGVGTVFIMNGSMTIGAVIAMSMYYQLLIQPVQGIIGSNVSMQKIIPVFDRIYEYLNIESEELDKGSSEVLTGGLEVRNLSFEYNENSPVLKNICLKVKDKELVAFIGKSGSGKSTFIKLLMGFYKPQEGEIFIGGRDINKIEIRTLRRNISYVPQSVDLLNMSIRDNIRNGRSDAVDEEIINICKKVRIHDMIAALPEGYDTLVNERVNLSGGEIQRIGICRALIKDPAVLILDEPTASLDPENEIIIRELIKEISRECTVIIIAHRMSTIINADRIFAFDDGKLVESGDGNSLMQKKGYFYNFVNNQVNND